MAKRGDKGRAVVSGLSAACFRCWPAESLLKMSEVLRCCDGAVFIEKRDNAVQIGGKP